MKKYFLVMLTIAAVVAASAFTFQKPKEKEKGNFSYFYQYTSGSHLKEDIQNRLNYERASESCDDGGNVCGVFLATDEGANQPPDADEFSAVADDLWDSQNSGSATILAIVMKD